MTQAAAMMERVARMNQELYQSNLHAVEALERTSNATPRILQNAAQQILGQLTKDVATSVQSGLNRPLQDFHHHIADGVNHVNGLTDGISQSRSQIAAVVDKLKWMVISVTAAMLLVVIVGGSLLWHYRSVIENYQIQADLMHAYNQADVRLCDGRLCARVERTDKRYGDYQLVKPRTE